MKEGDMTLGQELSKEKWEQAAKAMERLSVICCRILKVKCNASDEDIESCENDFMLAHIALLYVAHNAVNKCRFIPIPDSE